MPTKISWTDETWNPVTGCTKVSPGCKHCYASAVAERFWAKQYPYIPVEFSKTDPDRAIGWRARCFTDVQCHPERLDIPLRWRKPRKVFVCSMSDLFHEAVPDEFILRVFNVIRSCHTAGSNVWPSRHTFQILTKRPERMRNLMQRMRFDGGSDKGRMWFADKPEDRGGYAIMGGLPGCEPPPGVWLGATCENQEQLEARVPPLLETPAAVRFLSLEPLLSEIELPRHMGDRYTTPGPTGFLEKMLDWVIVGGESGPKARPCDVQWIRSIVQQCKAAGVPAFVKQLGSYPVAADVELADWPTAKWRGDPATGLGRGILLNSKGADPAEWPTDLQVQEFPR